MKSDSPAPVTSAANRAVGALEAPVDFEHPSTRLRNYSCTLFTDCLSLSPVNERDTVAIIGTLTGPTVRLTKGGNPMGSLSPWHWAILAVVIIVLFGAKRLPDAARSLGKSMRIFKSEMHELHADGTDPAAAAGVPGDDAGPPPVQPANLEPS